MDGATCYLKKGPGGKRQAGSRGHLSTDPPLTLKEGVEQPVYNSHMVTCALE